MKTVAGSTLCNAASASRIFGSGTYCWAHTTTGRLRFFFMLLDVGLRPKKLQVRFLHQILNNCSYFYMVGVAFIDLFQRNMCCTLCRFGGINLLNLNRLIYWRLWTIVVCIITTFIIHILLLFPLVCYQLIKSMVVKIFLHALSFLKNNTEDISQET